MVGGNPASAVAMNFEGMRRRGYSKELIAALRQAYKVVYREGLIVKDALAKLSDAASQWPEVALFVDSIKSSTRGITR
jgi:UDP-N-acetylglucosamine acyltransferase